MNKACRKVPQDPCDIIADTKDALEFAVSSLEEAQE